MVLMAGTRLQQGREPEKCKKIAKGGPGKFWFVQGGPEGFFMFSWAGGVLGPFLAGSVPPLPAMVLDSTIPFNQYLTSLAHYCLVGADK